MLIDLSELLPFTEGEREYRVSYERGSVLDYDISDAPETLFRIVHHRGNSFEIMGTGTVRVMIPCARCLEPVEQTILFTADRAFDLQTGLDTDGEACEFLRENTLDTDDMIADLAVMNLPIRVLCREDCRGLCVKCGANLNNGPCGCGEERAPTRMADAIAAAMNSAKNNNPIRQKPRKK